MVFAGQLRMEFRLHRSIRDQLCGLLEWIEEIPKALLYLVHGVPQERLN